MKRIQLARVASDQFTAHCRIAQSFGAIKTIERIISTLQGMLPANHRIANDLSRLSEPLKGLDTSWQIGEKAVSEKLEKLPDTCFRVSKWWFPLQAASIRKLPRDDRRV